MTGHTITAFDVEIDALTGSFGNSDELKADRFAVLEFTQNDVNILLEHSSKLAALQEQINAVFASYIFSTCKGALRRDPENAKALLELQISYFPLLTSGNYDEQYKRSRIAIGAIHQKLGLPFHQLIAAYHKYRSLLRPLIAACFSGNADAHNNYTEAMSKAICFDIGIELDGYYQSERIAPEPIQNDYDSVTGLRNRQSFKNQLIHMLQIAENKSTNVALIKIGLDDFKKLNDIGGYEAGDQVLIDLGKRIQSLLHKDDLIAYWGAITLSSPSTTSV